MQSEGETKRNGTESWQRTRCQRRQRTQFHTSSGGHCEQASEGIRDYSRPTRRMGDFFYRLLRSDPRETMAAAGFAFYV